MKKVILILIAILGLTFGSFAQNKPFSNPALIYGSDFGNFFKTLYAQGKFADMVKFTSAESIKKHGKDKIIDFYKNKIHFGYELGKLKSTNKEEDGSITLNYPSSQVFATKKVVRINVVIQNDSVKIKLPDNLKDF